MGDSHQHTSNRLSTPNSRQDPQFTRVRVLPPSHGESAHVPDKTACPRCNKVGLVRLETVIKGGQSRLHYYCGACAHEWELTEPQLAGMRAAAGSVFAAAATL